MSTTYNAKAGESLEVVSFRVYGTTSRAYLIARANPGVPQKMTGPTTLIIPDLPGQTETKKVKPPKQSELAVSFGGERFRYWETATFTRHIASVSTLTVTAPFEPDRPGFKETFRPFAFTPVTASIGESLAFTGTMLCPYPSSIPTRNYISVDSYSVPGVLQDCNAPDSMYPVQYIDTPLDVIADELCAPFGVDVKFSAPPGAAFEEVRLETNTKILPFLSGLAKQRGLIIRDTIEGGLEFHAPKGEGEPMARLSGLPAQSVVPSFSPQTVYSHVTGLEPVLVGLGGGAYTVKNGRTSHVLRPYVYSVTDAEAGGLAQAVEATAGRMFGDAIKYSIELPTWFGDSGELWEPGRLVELTAPRAMVYNPYTFIIQSVRLFRDAQRETATLTLTLPEVYSGGIPERLPWD